MPARPAVPAVHPNPQNHAEDSLGDDVRRAGREGAGGLDPLHEVFDLADEASLVGSDLVGDLSTRSPEFRTWWAAHNVR